MIERIFPRQLNNDYKGHVLAKWVFVLITIVTIGRSLIHIFVPDGGAQSIALVVQIHRNCEDGQNPYDDHGGYQLDQRESARSPGYLRW